MCAALIGRWRADVQERQPTGACHLTIKITQNDGKNGPAGKLADVELHFSEGPLEGLKLIGFTVWEGRGGRSRNVTFPARQYTVNGDRRSFALLRPIGDATSQNKIREMILDAYQEHEERAAVAD
jgi:hypothetical protein